MARGHVLDASAGRLGQLRVGRVRREARRHDLGHQRRLGRAEEGAHVEGTAHVVEQQLEGVHRQSSGLERVHRRVVVPQVFGLLRPVRPHQEGDLVRRAVGGQVQRVVDGRVLLARARLHKRQVGPQRGAPAARQLLLLRQLLSCLFVRTYTKIRTSTIVRQHFFRPSHCHAPQCPRPAPPAPCRAPPSAGPTPPPREPRTGATTRSAPCPHSTSPPPPRSTRPQRRAPSSSSLSHSRPSAGCGARSPPSSSWGRRRPTPPAPAGRFGWVRPRPCPPWCRRRPQSAGPAPPRPRAPPLFASGRRPRPPERPAARAARGAGARR